MAVAAAVHPRLTMPPPPPSAQGVVPWLARTGLAAVAADAVICLFVATMWLLSWGAAAMEIGRIALGEDSAMVAAACKVVAGTWPTHMLVVLFGVVPLMLDRSVAAKAPAPKSVAAAVYALMAFFLLVNLGVLLKGDSPDKGSRWERVGSAVLDVGTFGIIAVGCFVLCPIFTVWAWRTVRTVARPGL